MMRLQATQDSTCHHPVQSSDVPSPGLYIQRVDQTGLCINFFLCPYVFATIEIFYYYVFLLLLFFVIFTSLKNYTLHGYFSLYRAINSQKKDKERRKVKDHRCQGCQRFVFFVIEHFGFFPPLKKTLFRFIFVCNTKKNVFLY